MSLEKIENLEPRDRIIVCLYLMHNLDKKTEFLEKSDLLREMEEIVPNLFQGVNFNYYLSALIQKEGMVKETRFGSRGHKTYTLTKKARKRIEENTELSQIVREIIDKDKFKETVADENKEEEINVAEKINLERLEKQIEREPDSLEKNFSAADLLKLLIDQTRIQKNAFHCFRRIDDNIYDLLVLLNKIEENQREIISYLREIKSVKETQKEAEELKQELYNALNSSKLNSG